MRHRPTSVLTSVPIAVLAGSLALVAAPPATAKVVDRGPSSVLAGPALADLRDFVSAGGQTYVLGDSAVRVFAAGASGAATPQRTIDLDLPSGQHGAAIAVGRTGTTYVLTTDDEYSAATIFVYDATASGDAAYTSVDNTSLGLAEILDITDHGDGLAILDNDSNAIEFWNLPRQAPPTRTGGIDAGSSTQTRIFGPTGLDGAADGRLVVYGQDWISVFAAGADGDVAPQQYLQGSATQLRTPLGGGLDDAGSLYVGSAVLPGGGPATEARVLRFAPGATGDVAPAGVLAGASSGLSAPFVEVVPSGGFLSSNFDTTTYRLQPAIATNRALGPYGVPGAPASLAVGGKAKSAERTLVWSPAAVDPDVPVTAYAVAITCRVKATPAPGHQGDKGHKGHKGNKGKKGKKKPKAKTRVILRRDLPGTDTSVAVPLTKKIVKATCTVSLTARNEIGAGASAGTGFTVRR